MYMDKERFYVILGALLMIISLPALIAAGVLFSELSTLGLSN